MGEQGGRREGEREGEGNRERTEKRMRKRMRKAKGKEQKERENAMDIGDVTVLILQSALVLEPMSISLYLV